ncbi:MAG: metallopeptidase [Caldisphaeraceae archaeon]|nr:putative metallopeptidase [Caldisphaeraceae archaeon]MEB3797777.1 metallopeptidase [Caldisphaeraceae archaeon]
MIRYEEAKDLHRILFCLIERLGLNGLDKNRIKVIRSYNAKTRAYARIYSLPSAVRYALGLKPIYVIEVVTEKYSMLDEEERIKVLLHELLHIPPSFSGGLRPHGKYVNERIVNSLYRKAGLHLCIESNE